MTSVMDEGVEGRWAEWYDFVWNRTRAIRKVCGMGDGRGWDGEGMGYRWLYN